MPIFPKGDLKIHGITIASGIYSCRSVITLDELII